MGCKVSQNLNHIPKSLELDNTNDYISFQHKNILSDCKSNTTHIAALYGNKEWLEQQLIFRIWPDSPNNSGNTPIHIASWFGYEEIIKTILKYKYINVYRENNKGQTPMKIAIVRGHNECLQLMQQYSIKLKNLKQR